MVVAGSKYLLNKNKNKMNETRTTNNDAAASGIETTLKGKLVSI